MFVSCMFDNSARRHWTITDTNFIDEIYYEGSAWEALVKVYEARGLNVARNYAIAMMLYIRNLPPNNDVYNLLELLDKNPKVNPSLSKYRKDIEKELEKLSLLI